MIGRREALKGLTAIVGGIVASPALGKEEVPACTNDDLIVIKVGSAEWIPTQEEMDEFIQKISDSQKTGRLILDRPVTIGGKEIPYEVVFFDGFWSSAKEDLYVFKLGDPETGFLPTKEDEEDLANLLKIVEGQPGAAIITHYALQIERVVAFFNNRVKVVV